MIREPDDPKEIGARLEWLRGFLGYSMPEFAEAVGVKYDRYYNWETGRSRISPEGANRIWEDYGVSYDFLFLGIAGRLPAEMMSSWLASQKDRDTK